MNFVPGVPWQFGTGMVDKNTEKYPDISFPALYTGLGQSQPPAGCGGAGRNARLYFEYFTPIRHQLHHRQ
ncbi:MAG: hypothetical protein WCK34_12300 [Bacteroidota bacterium]